MKSVVFDDIDRFLAELGRESLFDYLGVAPQASNEEMEACIAARRRWAQAQQANPKFRTEAVWVIRNTARLREVLLSQRAAYSDHLDVDEDKKNLELLSLFIRGTMFSGRFTKDAEEAIRRQAERIGISQEVLDQRIEELLAQNDAVRAEHTLDDPLPEPEPSRPERSQPDPAPSDEDSATRLNARLRDVFAQQLLPHGEVEDILAKGRVRGFSPRQMLAQLDRRILELQGISTTPPPRRPATWQTLRPMDKTRLRELIDALRGAVMQDTLGPSMERLLEQQATKAGLPPHVWESMLATARIHLENFRTGAADPWSVLGMSGEWDRAEARRAYAQLRKWAWTHPDALKCARTSLELDAAWASILKE